MSFLTYNYDLYCYHNYNQEISRDFQEIIFSLEFSCKNIIYYLYNFSKLKI